MHAVAPVEAALALANRHRTKSDGSAAPGNSPQALRTPAALKTILGGARALMREHAHSKARIDYLAQLSAGADPSTTAFAPPQPTPAEEAEQILRAVLGRDPLRFVGLVTLIDSTLSGWQAELARLSAPVDVPTFEFLRPGQRTGTDVDNHRAIILSITGASQAQTAKLARLPALTDLAGRLATARATLGTAFVRRASQAVADAGGATLLTEALRESSRLQDATPSAEGVELLAGLQDELATLDGQLAKLGTGPPTGLAGQAMTAERAEIVARIAAIHDAAASKETAGHGSLVADALAFTPTAWAKILQSATAQPRAFPKGFAAAWAALAVDSLVEAGPADLVEPLEGSS
jgi:hypothetical protein